MTDNNELLIQITKDHAVTGEKLDRIAEDIKVLNTRMTRREHEIEVVATKNADTNDRVTKLETTVDIFKFLIGGALSLAGVALIEAIFDFMK